MRHTLLYLFLVAVLLSCKDQSNATDALTNAEKIIKENPDSATSILNKIDAPEDLQGMEKADYWRLKATANFRLDKAMTEDSLILYSLQYYKDYQITNKLIETYELAAIYRAWKKDISASINLLNEGINVAKQNRDSSGVANYYEDIASLQMDKDLFLAALSNYKESLLYRNSNKKKAGTYYSISLCYARLKQADSIQFYINRSIEFALNEKDTLSASHYLRNYADILFANNDYQGAIHCIERVLSFHQSTYSPNLFCTAAMCYLSLNKLDSAKYYCNQAKSLLNKNADTEKANSLITCRNLIMGLDAIIGYQQTKKVDLFKMARFNDSIMFDAHNKQLIINEKVSIKNQLEQQNLKLKVSKQHTQLLLIAGLFILVLLAGIIYIYIRNRRIRLIEVEERSETLQILLNDAIKGQTSNQIDSHFFKQILLQQLGLIHIMATNPTNQNQELLKQMARIANKEIPVSELLVWKDLYRVIDSIYDNFYSHLSQRYGNILLEKEMQLCCLLCGEFSTKEISVLTQQSLRTIYQRKTTIRQKLNMDEKEDIVSFLK